MNKEKLIQTGIDYDEGVNRFAGKPEIYEKFLTKFFEANTINELSQQLQNEDFDEAFKTAHDLKGNSGNLSLIKFYKAICDLVDILREEEKNKETYMSAFMHAKDIYELEEQAVKEM